MCFEKRQTLYIDSKGAERRSNYSNLADSRKVTREIADGRARISREIQKDRSVCTVTGRKKRVAVFYYARGKI